MLSLNIIPEKIKKENKLKNNYNFIKKLFFVLTINLCLYAILLLLSRLILEINFIKTVQETSIMTKNTASYSKKIRQLNSKLKQVNNIQKNNIIWSNFLINLSQNNNNKITFYDIKLNQTNGLATFSGHANTRENLLSFKKKLENNKNFTNINFPIANLLEKININFNITAKFKAYEFD